MVESPSVPWVAARHSLVATWRAWNTAVDTVFYNVASLSPEEQLELSGHLNPEGRVLVVYPEVTPRRVRSLTPSEFVTEQRSGAGDAVDAVAVAGVGSSALGTAALARDVANYLHRPVAGIVSGLGMSDVLAEALGGWLVFGARNAWRDYLARFFDAAGLKDHVRDEQTHREMKRSFAAGGLATTDGRRVSAEAAPGAGQEVVDMDYFIFGSPESSALLYLLLELGPGIKLLVGHSKGNLSIESALEGWRAAQNGGATRVNPDLRIVTLGAAIWFPSEFTDVHQFLGSIDALGLMNSRPAVKRVTVPFAWHTLNARLLGRLSVAEALAQAELAGGGAPGLMSVSLAREKAPEGATAVVEVPATPPAQSVPRPRKGNRGRTPRGASAS